MPLPKPAKASSPPRPGPASRRPALRDIAYHRENDSVTLLDWENEKKFIQHRLPSSTFFSSSTAVFVKNGPIRLSSMPPLHYASVEGSKRTLKGLKNLILDYNTLFYICHVLRPFGWIDVVSVDKARHYISKL